MVLMMPLFKEEKRSILHMAWMLLKHRHYTNYFAATGTYLQARCIDSPRDSAVLIQRGALPTSADRARH